MSEESEDIYFVGHDFDWVDMHMKNYRYSEHRR